MLIGGRLGKNELHELREFIFSLSFFLAKYVNISAQFGFLNMQIINKLKNVIFIACKWCKVIKLYLNSMVISYSYWQNNKKNAFGLNIGFTLFCCDFKFVVIYGFFSAKSEFPKF